MPRITTIPTKAITLRNTMLDNRSWPASLPCFWRVSTKTGMSVEPRAPINKFSTNDGSSKAMRNASRAVPRNRSRRAWLGDGELCAADKASPVANPRHLSRMGTGTRVRGPSTLASSGLGWFVLGRLPVLGYRGVVQAWGVSGGMVQPHSSGSCTQHVAGRRSVL